MLTASEDGIILRLFILTQYWRVADRQRNGRTGGNATQRAALRHAIKSVTLITKRNKIAFQSTAKNLRMLYLVMLVKSYDFFDPVTLT